jgi:hypothetical protein
MKIGRGNWSTWRKPAPVPLCPPQIPHDQTRARTWAAAVGSQQLTAWAMARPNFFVTPQLLFCGYKRYWKQTCRSNLTIYIYSIYTVGEFKCIDNRKKRHLKYKNYPPLFLDTKHLHINKIISIIMQKLNLSLLLRQFEKMWVLMWKTILCAHIAVITIYFVICSTTT